MNKGWAILGALTIIFMLAAPTKTLAENKVGALGTNMVGCSLEQTDGDKVTLGATITYIICIIQVYVTAIAVIIFMVIGLMYIIGAFKPDAAAAAKTILLTTITGLIFMYLTSFIINFLLLNGILATGSTTS